MQKRLDSSQEEFFAIHKRLDTFASKDDIQSLHVKLDGIIEQVAKNTEQDTAFQEVAAAVQEHETDIKLIKKVIAG